MATFVIDIPDTLLAQYDAACKTWNELALRDGNTSQIPPLTAAFLADWLVQVMKQRVISSGIVQKLEPADLDKLLEEVEAATVTVKMP